MLATLESLGVKAGHIIAVQLPSGPLYISILLASIQIGAVFCPLNLRLPNVEKHLKTLSPKLFFSSDMPQIFESEPSPLPPSSFLLFTSGSTSDPKIVSLTYENFLAAARSAIQVCDLQPQDTWLLSLPLHHVGGISIIIRSLLAGSKLTFDPGDRSITHISYVPTQLYRSTPIYPRLKTVLLGGAPITSIPERVPILASYGMTETASMILGKKNPVIKNGLTYLGFPHPGKEIRLSPEGEILLKGDSLFQGYWTGTELKKTPSWFPTKDLGHFDPTLGYAIVGRKDNQFISGGENIQPEEIERELLTHPEVLEALVVPKDDLEFGKRPVAFIQTFSPIDEKKLRFHLLKTLPKFKIPTAFLPLDLIRDGALKPSRIAAQIFLSKTKE